MAPTRPLTNTVWTNRQSNNSWSPVKGTNRMVPISGVLHSSSWTPAEAASWMAIPLNTSPSGISTSRYQSAPHMTSWSFHHFVTILPPSTGIPSTFCCAKAHWCRPVVVCVVHSPWNSTPNNANSFATKELAFWAMPVPAISIAGPKARCGKPVRGLMIERHFG